MLIQPFPSHINCNRRGGRRTSVRQLDKGLGCTVLVSAAREVSLTTTGSYLALRSLGYLSHSVLPARNLCWTGVSAGGASLRMKAISSRLRHLVTRRTHLRSVTRQIHLRLQLRRSVRLCLRMVSQMRPE